MVEGVTSLLELSKILDISPRELSSVSRDIA